jgi:hypothetical protein
LLPETAGKNIDEILFSILGTVQKKSSEDKKMACDEDDTVDVGEIID